MATGMQPKELGINYLVLCDNTKTQKVSSKSMTMRANFIGMLPRWLPTKIAKIVPLR